MKRHLITLSLIAIVMFASSQFAAAQDAPLTQAEIEASNQRWGETIEKFEAADRADPPKKGGVLFVGSSSIRMWDLEKWFPDLGALNRGFGGSEISDSINFFDRIVLPYEPKTIVFYAGDNDIAHKESPESVARDYKNFAAMVHKSLPETRILYVAIKPSIARWNLIDTIRKANSLIQAQTEKDPLATFIDIDRPMLGDDGKPRAELLLKDGLHMTDAGYQIWVDLVNKAMADDPQKSEK